MRKVLLYYSFGFSFGGGEHLPLAFIASLQSSCDLTVALDVPENLDRASAALGAGIDTGRFNVVKVTPPGYEPGRHGALDSIYRFRALRSLAREADVCISAANVMDFGRPAHHFINMLAFGDDAFTRYALGKGRRAGAGARARLLAESVLRPILGMRSKRGIVCDPKERIYPNSRYVDGLMRGFYGNFFGEVFYPPVMFEPSHVPDAAHDPLKVVYIGRIVPEKRIEDLVSIVERSRAVSGLGISFHVAGRLDQSPTYGRKLGEMAEGRPWLKFVGPLYGEEKERFLTSGSYALHAERVEAFGISVAEYLKAGLVPVVPDSGGAPEVVGEAELKYGTCEEASRILARLATDAEFRQRCRRRCAVRAATFSREAYETRQRKLLAEVTA